MHPKPDSLYRNILICFLTFLSFAVVAQPEVSFHSKFPVLPLSGKIDSFNVQEDTISHAWLRETWSAETLKPFETYLEDMESTIHPIGQIAWKDGCTLYIVQIQWNWWKVNALAVYNTRKKQWVELHKIGYTEGGEGSQIYGSAWLNRIPTRTDALLIREESHLSTPTGKSRIEDKRAYWLQWQQERFVPQKVTNSRKWVKRYSIH